MNIKTSILRSVAPVAFAAISIHALGCIAGPSESGLTEEDFLGHAELGIGGDPGSTNHYEVACFWDHGTQQTFRDLAGNAIIDGEGTLPVMPYMENFPLQSQSMGVDCREQMLELLVTCALDDSQVALDQYTNTTFNGHLGYAPDWTTRELTTDEKELVTACMLQRLNPFRIVLPVLLEKPDEPVDAALASQYSYEESEVWGNLFDSTVDLIPGKEDLTGSLPVAFPAYGCEIDPQPSLCEDMSSGLPVPWATDCSPWRACMLGDGLCNLTRLGTCTSTCTDNVTAWLCDAFDNRLRVRGIDNGSLGHTPL